VTYSFRNRFRLPGGDRLDADVREIKLADSADDGLVTLQAASHVQRPGGLFTLQAAEEMRVSERTALISEASELVVQGSGYVDADTGAAAGRKWRQYLTVALARERKGSTSAPMIALFR
jgi:hypothetical protein